jgi:membrane-associated protease RseP (regulator of RpoE activity)
VSEEPVLTDIAHDVASTDIARQLSEAVRAVFVTEQVTTGLAGGLIRLEGQLLTEPEQAYQHMEASFRPLGYTPVLRETQSSVQITAVPLISVQPSRDSAAILLFALTVISMLFAGAWPQAPDLAWMLKHPLAGLPFAAPLLGILLAHELGHYFMARHLGLATSLPYFIPMPLSPFGTMGAVIRMRAPMRNRRHLLAVGAAGPLAGLLVALPALIFGLTRSSVQPIPTQAGVIIEGNSLLYVALKLLVLGQILPRHGYDVFLHPTAFAAWAGLLLTGLNLTPAGQLDVGHIAYALLGKKTRLLSRLAIVVCVALGFIYWGWFIFAVLLLLLGQRSAEPLDDATTLTTQQKMFAAFMLVLFVLLFTPVPMSVL